MKMKLLPMICLVCVAFLQTTVGWAISYTWNGSVSSQWGNASNWTPAGVPLATDDVTIVTAPNAPGLSDHRTVAQFTLTSGSLLLNGHSLTITGNASFLAGTIGSSNAISSSSITATGTSTIFGTTTGGPIIYAIVNIKSATLTFQFTTFNGTTTLEKTGASGDRSAGANTFGGVTSITNSGSGYLTLAESSKDEFLQDVTFTYSGSGPSYGLYPAYRAAGNVFKGNIILNSTGNCREAVHFGAHGGTSTLTAGKTISSRTLTAGVILLKHFNSPVTEIFTVNGTTGASLTLGPNITFNNEVNVRTGGILLNGCTFNSTTTLEKTGASGDRSAGANTFGGVTSITNSGSGYLTLAESSKDEFLQDVTFTYSGSGSYGIFPAYRAAGNVFKGNIILNSTGGSTYAIHFGEQGGTSILAPNRTISSGKTGFSTGTITLTRFTEPVSGSVIINGTTSAKVTLGPALTFANSVNVKTGSITLNGGTFNGLTTLEKTGPTGDVGDGGNTFNGVTALTNSATGGYWIIGQNSMKVNIFNAALNLNSTGSSPTYLNRASAGNVFKGNITITSTGTATILFGDIGGKSTLGSVESSATIITERTTFTNGTLNISGLTQESIDAISLQGMGNSVVTIGPGTSFKGIVNIKAGGVELSGGTFHNTAIIEKTSPTGEHGDGGNTFNGVTTLTNSATGGFWVIGASSTKVNTFNATLNLNSTGSSPTYLNRYSTGNVFKGNINVTSTGTATIFVGDAGGKSTLGSVGSSATITSQGATFTNGTLSISGLTQESTDAITMEMTGTAQLVVNKNTIFNGPVNFTAPYLYLNGGTFMQASTFIKTNNVDNGCVGGNIFMKKAKFQCQGTGRLFLAQQFADVVR